jgi:hypothetical protein
VLTWSRSVVVARVAGTLAAELGVVVCDGPAAPGNALAGVLDVIPACRLHEHAIVLESHTCDALSLQCPVAMCVFLFKMSACFPT